MEVLVVILFLGVVISIILFGAGSDVPPVPPPAPPRAASAKSRSMRAGKQSGTRRPTAPRTPSGKTRRTVPAPTTGRAPTAPGPAESSPWPRRRQYESAVAHARSFNDTELTASTLRRHNDGRPLVASGSKAVAFIMDAPGRTIALRCFLNEPDLSAEERYRALERFQHDRDDNSCTAPSSWLTNGIKVEGRWRPVIKMTFVDGPRLGDYVRDPSAASGDLNRLSHDWLRLCTELTSKQFAHGDLQLNNVIVERGSSRPRLIDLDAAWLPQLQTKRPSEKGHKNFQHPQRMERGDWGQHIDLFSALSIYTSLRAIATDRSLSRFCTDQQLLFKEADYHHPGRTEIWQLLGTSRSAELRVLSSLLSRLCTTSVSIEANLGEVVSSSSVPTHAPYRPAKNGPAQRWFADDDVVEPSCHDAGRGWFGETPNVVAVADHETDRQDWWE